jgi:hypothetical protein
MITTTKRTESLARAYFDVLLNGRVVGEVIKLRGRSRPYFAKGGSQGFATADEAALAVVDGF